MLFDSSSIDVAAVAVAGSVVTVAPVSAGEVALTVTSAGRTRNCLRARRFGRFT